MNGSDLPSSRCQPGGRLLLTEQVTAAWQVLTAQLQGSLPAAAGVGISLLDRPATPTSVAATSRLVVAADQAQYRLDEGPCLTAWAERRAVRVDDLRANGRWPRWAAAALSLSIRSVLSSPLLTAGGQAFGSVKLYSLSSGRL
jgi:GAF domain-containing protein